MSSWSLASAPRGRPRPPYWSSMTFLPGYPLDGLGKEFEHCLLLCATEVNTSEQISRLTSALSEMGSAR